LEEQLNSQVSELQTQIEIANQNQAQLQSQASDLENQLETVRQSRSQLESQLETANRERSHIYAQLSEMQSQIETANQNQNQLQSQISELENHLETVYQERLQPTSEIAATGEESPKAELVDKNAESTPESAILKNQEFVVSQQGEGDYITISEALKNAVSGTRIYVHPGVYKESIIIDKSVEIIGNIEAGSVTVESSDANCIQMVTDSALVRGLTIKTTGKYYAVDIRQGELIVEDSDITSANYSVVVICGSNANSVIRRCQIHDGIWNGIFISDNGKATVEDCNISNNGTLGIGVGLGGKLIARRCRINGNEGEAIAVYRDGIATVDDCDLTGNTGGAWRIADNGYIRGKGNQE
jgi:Right handed beta helix region